MPKVRLDATINLNTMLLCLQLIVAGWVIFGGTTDFLISNKVSVLDIATAKKENADRKAEIADLRKEIGVLRTQDTSIAVIKVDVATVKDNVADLKNAMQRLEARVIDRLPTRAN